MPKKILVSLISDQTIPNILAIHHFNPDELLFITTEEMERKEKIKAIMDTLSELKREYYGKESKIIVREDSILDCHKKIEKWIEGKEDSEFIINLTGGTKIMSIAAYEFFKDFGSQMIYIPIPKNEYIIPFPKKNPKEPIPLSLKLKVTEYLNAYGLHVIQKEKLLSHQEEAQKRYLLSEWIVLHYESIKNLLSWLYSQLNNYRGIKRPYEWKGQYDPTPEERLFLEKANFRFSEGIISKIIERSEVKYLTGGWLEEFCFNQISELKGRGIDDCVIGLQLTNPQGRNNEFDVMFTKDNELYFVECKTLDQKDRETDILYKIGALQKDFGLRVKSFLVTTSSTVIKDGQLIPSVRERAEQFKTEIITLDKLRNFKDVMSEKLYKNWR